MTRTDQEICSEYSKTFQTVFTQELLSFKVRTGKTAYGFKVIVLDNIVTFILKTIAEELTVPLSHLCNLSSMTGELPKEWKIADIIPIFKESSNWDRALNC